MFFALFVCFVWCDWLFGCLVVFDLTCRIPPTPRGFHTASLLGKSIYVSCGHGNGSVQADMFMLTHPFDNSGFVSMLGVDLVQAFDQEELADVCFVFLEEGKQIFAHKIVLACRSDRMRELFSSGSSGDAVQLIEIPNRYSYVVFYCMLK